MRHHMAWNKFDHNKPKTDPWGKKNDQKDDPKHSTENNTNEKKYIFDFKKFIFNITKSTTKKTNSIHSSNFSKNSINSCIIIVVVAFFVWCTGGFYTIKETERGVVTRFGKFSHLVKPGLNWRPMFINTVQAVNVETIRELATSGMMLTSDENVVCVEMNVQYKIINPANYLFSVDHPDDSLRQATDSALRGVIGRLNMDTVLTEGRTLVRSDTQKEIEMIIKPYHMGIAILDVNFQTARPPEEVKSAFDDAIAARENREQYVREAEAYANEVEPKANGKAQRILEEAKAYSSRIISESEGEVVRFLKILPEYKKAKKITLQRLYIESMEKLFSKTKKIFINKKNDMTFFLSLKDVFYNSKLHKKDLSNKASMINNIKNDKKFNKQSHSSFWFSPKYFLKKRHFDSIRSNLQHVERK